VTNQITNEKSTASNIKSKNTRKNVLTALEKIVQHLRLFKQTPANGLVVFCGNISPIEGKEDIRIWSFEPPIRMQQKIYWCDQRFILDPLKDLVAEKEVYGLLVLDAREANIGFLRGKMLEQVKHMDSTVPSKSVKGGMSQMRYDRIREDALNEFFTKVAEAASEIFLKEKDLVGIIVGGPGPNKENFYKRKYLHYQVQGKVLGVRDTGYTGEFGLEELVQRSKDLMEQAAIVKERELMEKFFKGLKGEGNVVYGFTETEEALGIGAVETLLLSEDFNWVHVKLKCSSCGNEERKNLPENVAAKQMCEKCGQQMAVEETKELSDVLAEKAVDSGARVEYISTSTQEGKQFKELGGVGAFLRYKLKKD
jgi:peptide chain release factor subunit 1